VYIIVAITMLIAFLGTRALGKLFFLCGFYVDYVTFFFIIWNVTVTGAIVMFTYGPVLAHRAYSISYCALFVNFLVMLLRPPLLLWILTVFLCVWDLIAVLCPFGPLKLLVKTAQERGQMDSKFLSALVYSSGILLLAASDGGSSVERKESKGSSGVNTQDPPAGVCCFFPPSRLGCHCCQTPGNCQERSFLSILFWLFPRILKLCPRWILNFFPVLHHRL
jgi:hypothetical protein